MGVSGAERVIPDVDEDEIRLVIPGAPEHVRLARLVGGGIASNQTVGMALVEDTRIAVDEVCAALVEFGRGQPLTLSFRPLEDALVLQGSTHVSVEPSSKSVRLVISQRILDALAGWHELIQSDGQVLLTVSIPFKQEPGGASPW